MTALSSPVSHSEPRVPEPPGYVTYRFAGVTGYILAPWLPGAKHDLVSMRHSAGVEAWADAKLHVHSRSEEFYLLLQGELHVMVHDLTLVLKPGEMACVRSGFSHGIVGGAGQIEHFVLRVPAASDWHPVAASLIGDISLADELPRSLSGEWGCRIPLAEPENQNCWLFGSGTARYPSQHMCLASLSFLTDASVRADRHQHGLHQHRESWEYYTVLKGARVLQVEDELVEVGQGEILEVPPGSRHVLRSTRTPFEGFTFRVPLLSDKVEC